MREEPAEREPEQPCERGRDPHEQRRRNRGERREVRHDRHPRHLVEMEQQDRRDAELRGQRGARRERDRLGHHPRQSLGQRRRQRHHAAGRRHTELEPDRPHQPGVERQEHEDGSGQDGCGRARPPHEHADQRQGGHDAGAHHRGFGAGEHHEERHRAQREQEPRPPRETHPCGERQHGRQDHGDVLAAHHQQVAEPGRVEVAREPGIELGVVAEHQPQQQPGFLRREEPGDRGAHERAEHLRGADERVRRPAQPLVLAELDGDRDAFVVQHVREPGIVGDLERAFEQDPVAADRSAGEVLTRR